jgi:hypothetical protein
MFECGGVAGYLQMHAGTRYLSKEVVGINRAVIDMKLFRLDNCYFCFRYIDSIRSDMIQYSLYTCNRNDVAID